MRYLLVRAAGHRLLVEASLVAGVSRQGARWDANPEASVDAPGAALHGAPASGVDLGVALGGSPCQFVVSLTPAARVAQLGVESCDGLVDVAEEALSPLPPILLAAAGGDVDAVTRDRFGGTEAFRLRLARPPG